MPEKDRPGNETSREETDRQVYYTVKQVAKMIGVSSRWLADRCRAEDVEHVYIARKRKFTPSQMEKVLARYTVRGPDIEAERKENERIARSAARARARGNRRS